MLGRTTIAFTLICTVYPPCYKGGPDGGPPAIELLEDICFAQAACRGVDVDVDCAVEEPDCGVYYDKVETCWLELRAECPEGDELPRACGEMFRVCQD